MNILPDDIPPTALASSGEGGVVSALQRVEALEDEIERRVAGLAARFENLLDNVERREQETSARLQRNTGEGQPAPDQHDPASDTELRQALELQRELTDEAVAEAEQLRAELASLGSEVQSEVEALRRERDELRERLEAEPSDDADLQRRYQMSLEDIRGLRAEIEELKKQPKSPSTSEFEPNEAFDWETQKQRMIAELDGDDGQSLTEQERADARRVILASEQIVAEKDRQIEELRSRLDQHVAVRDGLNGEASEAVDADALVQQERANLRELQMQWEEKLRSSEIEISIERAKLAREKTQLENTIAAFESEKKQVERMSPPATESSSKEEAPPTTKRWLARLGLADND